MKKTSLYLIIVTTLLLSVLLTACRGAAAPANAPQGGNGNQTSQPTQAPVIVETPTAAPSPTDLPQPTATATALPDTAKAEQAAQDYFSLLEKADFDQASDQVSAFSLMVFNLTRGEAASQLKTEKANGAQWSDFKILDSRTFNDLNVLVHVTFNEQSKEGTTARDELWPFRLENGAWRYNWNNLIDYHTLDADPKTTNGITVMPTQVMRYTDRVELVMLIQNRTNDPVVFGQVNEILGTFHFGDHEVGAEKAQFILNPLRSVPDAKLAAKGLYESYPDSIEIRKWKSYNVTPWYVFQLQ